MLKEDITKLENIVDKEIDGYKHIEKLYVDKKEILMRGKGTDLYDIDSKIVNAYKKLNDLTEVRKTITKAWNIPTFSMTDMISFVKKEDVVAAEKFTKKKEEVSTLAKKIFELENIETKDLSYLVNSRTLAILKQCLILLNDLKNNINSDFPIDMIEIDIKEIWNELGKIIGETYEEELLDELFSRFCLGK